MTEAEILTDKPAAPDAAEGNGRATKPKATQRVVPLEQRVRNKVAAMLIGTQQFGIWIDGFCEASGMDPANVELLIDSARLRERKALDAPPDEAQD
jgi:hypothetical protein